jgi:ABC-type transport system substrate-binding protein
MSDYDPARARALLDMYGYLDRTATASASCPTAAAGAGAPPSPSRSTASSTTSWRRGLKDIGVRCEFKIAQWPEQPEVGPGRHAADVDAGPRPPSPTASHALRRWYGPESGQQNLARFKLPAFDAIWTACRSLPDGPERDALFLDAKKLAAAYMPYKVHGAPHCQRTAAPLGERLPAHPFWSNWWHMVDVDPALRRPCLN